MKTIAQPSDTTIERLLTDSALMFDVITTQRKTAVKVAYAAGWTYERIAAIIGRSYPATRALALSTDLEDAA